MNQKEHRNNADKDWEPVPWNTSDEVADEQLKGFKARSVKPIHWRSIRNLASGDTMLFGLDRERLIGLDVEYTAEHEGEQLLLIQLAWHGFPDPPEWGLMSRRVGAEDAPFESWGFFAHLPSGWIVPPSGIEMGRRLPWTEL